MRKFIVVAVFLVLALAAAAGVFFLRGNLARLPWAKVEPFDFPEAAFVRDDGSCVIFDRQGARMLSVDRDANLQWSVSGGNMYGRFLSADMDSGGTLYVIDQRRDGDTPYRFERIMRVAPDGTPAGVLVQNRVQGKAGYVAGSLRAGTGGTLWYLSASEAGLVTATKMTVKDGDRQAVVKTEWALSRAVLAVDGPDGALVVNAGGGLVRFVRGRFEALAELSGPLPFPVDIRYDKEGSLLVADAAGGLIARVGSDGTAVVLVRQKDSSALSPQNPAAVPSPRDFFMGIAGISGKPARLSTASRIDSFSLLKEGYASVDRMNGKVVFFNGKGTPVRVLTGAALSPVAMRNCLFAWTLAGAGILFSLLFLISLSIILVTGLPRGLALVFAALPGAALVIAVVMIIFIHDYSGSLAAAQEGTLAGLRGMASSGVMAFDAEKLDAAEPYVGQADTDVADYKRQVEGLRKSAGGESVANVTLYKLGRNGLITVCDSAGMYPVGFPQRLVPDAYLRDMLAGSAYSGAAEGPAGRWLIGAAPVKTGSGKVVGVVEFVRPAAGAAAESVLASALAGNGKYLLLVCLGLAFAGAGSLLTVSLRSERAAAVPAASAPDVFSGMKTDGDYSLGGGFERESRVPEMRAGAGERFEPDFDDSGISDVGISDADIDGAGTQENGANEDSVYDDEPFGIPELEDAEDMSFEDIPELPGEFEIKPLPAEKVASPVAPKGQNSDTAVKIPPFAIPSVEHQKLHRQAIAALKDGKVDDAVALLEKILAENPEDSRALNNIGVACKRQGRLSAAIGYLEKALSLEPENGDTRANLERLRRVV